MLTYIPSRVLPSDCCSLSFVFIVNIKEGKRMLDLSGWKNCAIISGNISLQALQRVESRDVSTSVNPAGNHRYHRQYCVL